MQDEDVTKLTDEELDAKLNGAQPEEPEKEATEEPADTPDEPEPQVEPKEPQEEEPEEKKPEEEERPPSRREQLRIHQILEKRAQGSQPQPQQKPSQPTRQDALNYQEALDADPETINRFEEDRRASGDARYNEGLAQAQQLADARNAASEFRTNIKLDYPLVKGKLDKLDPEDVRALDTEYLQMTGYDTQTGLVQNPNIGYAEYVEARIEQAQRLADSMTAETTKNIAKQAAQTGLRPDGSSAKSLNLNKLPSQMSDEELNAVLARGGMSTNSPK